MAWLSQMSSSYGKVEPDMLRAEWQASLPRSQTVAEGVSWTEGADNKVDYVELSQMIDTAVEFLCDKCEELAAGPVRVDPDKHSRPSCEQADLTSQPTTTAASTSATSKQQSAAPPAFTVTKSFGQETEPVQPVDETQLKPVLARIAIIEVALNSFLSSAEKIAEQQSGNDQQLNELLSKIPETDQKHNSRFKTLKEEISEINGRQDAIAQDSKTRLQGLEKQQQKLSAAQGSMKAEMKSQTELTNKQLQKLSTVQDSMKLEMKYQTELTNKQLQKLSATQDRLDEDIESEASMRQKQLQNVYTLCSRMKADMDSQEQRLKKLIRLPNDLHCLEKKVDDLDNRIDTVTGDYKKMYFWGSLTLSFCMFLIITKIL